MCFSLLSAGLSALGHAEEGAPAAVQPAAPAEAPAATPAAPVGETAPVGASASSEEDSEDPAPVVKVPKKTKKVRRPVEKDTEGTQAPNRFQADTVIKSQYQLGGEPLEVDPD